MDRRSRGRLAGTGAVHSIRQDPVPELGAGRIRLPERPPDNDPVLLDPGLILLVHLDCRRLLPAPLDGDVAGLGSRARLEGNLDIRERPESDYSPRIVFRPAANFEGVEYHQADCASPAGL